MKGKEIKELFKWKNQKMGTCFSTETLERGGRQAP